MNFRDATTFRNREEARQHVKEIYRTIDAARRDEVFITLRPESEVLSDIEKAFDCFPESPLTGMVIAVKDNIDVAGLPTTAACPGYEYTASQDAAVVAELRAHGAVFIGKTNLDQFATGLVGTRSPYGAVRDAARPERISGGSSSGSAVAVALGFADAALGTDTAGSGRVPAGLQGLVGIKPTLATVSNEGLVPACKSWDCITVFAREQETAHTVMSIMRRTGQRKSPSNQRFTAPLRATVAIPRELPELSATWNKAFAQVAEKLSARGCEVIEIDLSPALEAAKMLYESALVSERYEAVGEFVDQSKDTDGIDPTVGSIIHKAKAFSGVDVLAAQRKLQRLKAAAMEEFSKADVLMVPTAPFHPTIEQVEEDPIGVNARMGTYTNFCNLFDLAAIAVPAGQVPDDGCGATQGPANFGVTFLAEAFEDAVVAGVARLIDKEDTPYNDDPHSEDAVSLCVFGAHLVGQPLNHELRQLGATLVGDITTAPHYKLYALDTVPPKPGLVDDSEGAAISGEEWRISVAGLGKFLAGLPAPMTLGSFELADGRELVGFSCNPGALKGANDITEFGEWRTYMERG